MSFLWIKNGRVIDPAAKRDSEGDVFIANGKFAPSLSAAQKKSARIIDARGLVVCPTFSVAVPAPSAYAAKEKLALSIGRITDRGHGKNQHSIIEAFRATAGNPDYADWRLCLVGGFDHRDARDAAYLARITEMAAGDPRIELLPNCPRATVNALLAKSAIYVHAAGLGQPEDKPLSKACSQADAVIVYAFSSAADVWWKGIENKLTRLDRLQVWRLPTEVAPALAALAERSMQLQATVQEGGLTLSSTQGSVQVDPIRWK